MVCVALSACATNRVLEFVVDERGTPIPETLRVVRTTDSNYSNAIVADVPSWRYAPAQRNGSVVKQLVTSDNWAQAVLSSGASRPPPPSRPTC